MTAATVRPTPLVPVARGGVQCTYENHITPYLHGYHCGSIGQFDGPGTTHWISDWDLATSGCVSTGAGAGNRDARYIHRESVANRNGSDRDHSESADRAHSGLHSKPGSGTHSVFRARSVFDAHSIFRAHSGFYDKSCVFAQSGVHYRSGGYFWSVCFPGQVSAINQMPSQVTVPEHILVPGQTVIASPAAGPIIQPQVQTTFGLANNQVTHPALGTTRADVIRQFGQPSVTVNTRTGETLYFDGGRTVITLENGQVSGPK